MEKVGLHIKDGKITTDDGKELLLVYVDALERLQEQLNEANEAIMSMVGNGPHTADEIGQAYLERWGVK